MKAVMISGCTLGQGATCEAKMKPEVYEAPFFSSLSEGDYKSMCLWTNAIIGPDIGGCGTPQYKGVGSEVMPTKLAVKGVRELFADVMDKRGTTS